MVRTYNPEILFFIIITLVIKSGQPHIFIVDHTFAKAIDNCIEEPLETREQKAAVIVTAKVLDIEADPHNDKLKVAKIQIKRVFKGNDIISAISDERPKAISEDSFNKVILIYGIGESTICNSNVNKGDTKIFLSNLEYFGNLRISSSIVSISSYNLDKTDAAVKDIPFDVEPPKKSPCVGVFCPFHARCFVNVTSNSPYCACVDDCVDHVTSPVCGTDHNTYENECLLRLTSCQRQRRIKVDDDGACYDPCDGIRCPGQQVCKLNKEREAVCQCEASCEQTLAPVCGSDGTTYGNECMLRQKACQEDRQINVLYPAKCKEDNPCTSLKCAPNRDCSIDHMGQATCVCPMPCQQMMQLVCGSDGNTYDSPCELKRQTCLQNTYATLAHYGPCEKGEAGDSDNEG